MVARIIDDVLELPDTLGVEAEGTDEANDRMANIDESLLSWLHI